MNYRCLLNNARISLTIVRPVLPIYYMCCCKPCNITFIIECVVVCKVNTDNILPI